MQVQLFAAMGCGGSHGVIGLNWQENQVIKTDLPQRPPFGRHDGRVGTAYNKGCQPIQYPEGRAKSDGADAPRHEGCPCFMTGGLISRHVTGN